MFQIEEIDPKYYRKQTRNATLKIMAMFIVIGMITATTAVEYLGAYSSNLIVLNLMGAFVGLIITGFIVKFFFKDKPWMYEAMYAWRLKRNLMQISNTIDAVKAAAKQNNENALKTLRFYHLGLTQMHQLEDNNHALMDLKAEKEQLVQQMINLGYDIDQTTFNPSQLDEFRKEQ